MPSDIKACGRLRTVTAVGNAGGRPSGRCAHCSPWNKSLRRCTLPAVPLRASPSILLCAGIAVFCRCDEPRGKGRLHRGPQIPPDERLPVHNGMSTSLCEDCCAIDNNGNDGGGGGPTLTDTSKYLYSSSGYKINESRGVQRNGNPVKKKYRKATKLNQSCVREGRQGGQTALPCLAQLAPSMITADDSGAHKFVFAGPV